MSPEQVESARDVGAAADIWSISAVLYRILTGRSPFRRKTATASFAALLTGKVPPVDHFRLDVPEKSTQLIYRGLEKRAAERPTMDEFTQELAQFAPPDGELRAESQRGSSLASKVDMSAVQKAPPLMENPGEGVRRRSVMPTVVHSKRRGNAEPPSVDAGSLEGQIPASTASNFSMGASSPGRPVWHYLLAAGVLLLMVGA